MLPTFPSIPFASSDFAIVALLSPGKKLRPLGLPPPDKPEAKPVVEAKKPLPIKRGMKPIGRPGGQPSGPTKKNNDDDDVPVAR